MINISQDEFFKKHNLDSSLILDNKINWKTLEEIYKDFVSTKDSLSIYSDMIAQLLRTQDKIHTVRSRIKDPEHLIAKLIRKTPERKKNKGEDFEFTVENYKDEITDLIGVRVIHIFKEDWKSIHDFIINSWNVVESVANVREGDNDNNYTELNVNVDPRKTGYRSVHYLIEFTPTINKKITVEIQVRTIFEEGYGEVDHQLSYPASNVPGVLTLNLLLLNRLAGSADEMASAIKELKKEWSKRELALLDKENEIAELKQKIKNLNIEENTKTSLVKDLDSISDFIDMDWNKNLKGRIEIRNPVKMGRNIIIDNKNLSLYEQAKDIVKNGLNS